MIECYGKRSLFSLYRMDFYCWKVLMASSEVIHNLRQNAKLVSRKNKLRDSLSRACTIFFQVVFYQSKLQTVIHIWYFRFLSI